MIFGGYQDSESSRLAGWGFDPVLRAWMAERKRISAPVLFHEEWLFWCGDGDATASSPSSSSPSSSNMVKELCSSLRLGFRAPSRTALVFCIAASTLLRPLADQHDNTHSTVGMAMATGLPRTVPNPTFEADVRGHEQHGPTGLTSVIGPARNLQSVSLPRPRVHTSG
jgi:hypothetical protein